MGGGDSHLIGILLIFEGEKSDLSGQKLHSKRAERTIGTKLPDSNDRCDAPLR